MGPTGLGGCLTTDEEFQSSNFGSEYSFRPKRFLLLPFLAEASALTKSRLFDVFRTFVANSEVFLPAVLTVEMYSVIR